MLEVIVLCEGQTEREFCREIVAPELAAHGLALSGTLVGKPQRKRGGIRDWAICRAELIRLAKEREDRHLAVLVDYYGMPSTWPGRVTAAGQLNVLRGKCVEDAITLDLAGELPGRFHPCIALHKLKVSFMSIRTWRH